MPKYDIIVIGAGHAGIEAACVAAKMGASVLVVTGNLDMIGQMSCNPAIGGVAKGNIVREIDALGGVMGSLIDKAGIQFRMLNSGKGSAVWGPRAQADKIMYRSLARQTLEMCPNVMILQALVTNLGVHGERIRTVTLNNGEIIDAGAVIVTAGTFLNGVIHIGLHSHSGGRAGEPPACGLTESLAELGIKSGRLKTGTPPRVDGQTIDRSKMAEQRGDDDPFPFSFFTRDAPSNKIVCWTTRTNVVTHGHIRENLDRSPLYSGKIASIGPRYCPSIEDKVVKFGDRDGHILYLEPESLETSEMYVNGLSTSLPFDVQEKMVTSVAGMENARILRPGYAIEYDYFLPTQLKPTLESKIVQGLFFAGQVNGTSGYEEAAGQGLIAAMNAVLSRRGEEPVILGRDEAYIGVLIDDLVTKGTEEPYRMFTSRAEYRLILRQDNCDERLMPIAHRVGAITQEQYDERRRFWDRKRDVKEWLSGVKITPDIYNRTTGRTITHTESAMDLLRRPEVSIAEILAAAGSGSVDNFGVDMVNQRTSALESPDCGVVNNDLSTCGQFVDNLCRSENAREIPVFDRYLTLGVESDIKYVGFVRKQLKDIEKMRRYEETKIPNDFSYDDVPGLLTESRQKLKKIRPNTLGQASRISGVTPSDVSVLAMCILKS